MRRKLLERDGRVCGICRGHISLTAKPPDERSLSIDHKIPFHQGGTNALSNLQLAHRGCNERKGMMSPRTFNRRYERPIPP